MTTDIKNKSVALREQAAHLLVKDEKSQKILAVIETKEALKLAGELHISLGEAVKDIEKYHEAERVGRYNHWKEKVAEIAGEVNPLEEIRTALKNGMNAYVRKVEQERIELQRKADEQARIEAAKATAKIEKKIEKAEANGDFEKAAVLEEEKALIVPVSIVPDEQPIKSQVGSGTIFGSRGLEIEVVDARLLVKEIAEGRLPIGAVEFKTKVLKDYVKSFDLNEVPGLKIERPLNANTRKK